MMNCLGKENTFLICSMLDFHILGRTGLYVKMGLLEYIQGYK